MSKKLKVILEKSTHDRIDHVLLALFQNEHPELTRSRFQSLIEGGFLTLDGVLCAKSNIKATAGTYLLEMNDPVPSHIEAKAMDFEIIFDDDDLVVINKPPYLTVHPGAGNKDHTLVNGLLHLFGDSLSGIGGIQRPGIVHRLDKDTSGLMVIAKNDLAHQKLSAQFSDRTLSRTYIAFVFGCVTPPQGKIETHIGRHPQNRQKMAIVSEHKGKIAITHYKVLKTYRLSAFEDEKRSAHKKQDLAVSKIECSLATGRTHQIRVHIQHLGYPLVGDPVYGKKTLSKTWPEIVRTFPRQALHAHKIKFLHPRTGEEMSFSAALPKDMQDLENAMS